MKSLFSRETDTKKTSNLFDHHIMSVMNAIMP